MDKNASSNYRLCKRLNIKTQVESKWMEKICHENSKHEKAVAAILKSDNRLEDKD